MKITVRINGTDENPWAKMNLRQNPFPQIPKAEYETANRQLNSLDGEPVRGEADIRARLQGWTEEFIQACLANYVPGERTQFTVSFPDAP